MSSESAEKLLANEKDGSFIVRDSSDDRYIFSLTFKLNSSIMHVRIEHGQGNMIVQILTFLSVRVCSTSSIFVYKII